MTMTTEVSLKRPSSQPGSPKSDAKRQATGASSSFPNQLLALKSMTSVVADTGDIEKIKQFKPEDATTNPTLLLQAVQMPEYQGIVEKCIGKFKGKKGEDAAEDLCDELAVAFGGEILKLVPGYVSTEINANLSFNTQASIDKARKIIKMYESAGFSKDRILIKLASTWECIKACEVLEKEGIKCNMTLLFSFAQAVACAEANATLISPFVGRILDWYKKANPSKESEYMSLTGGSDPLVYAPVADSDPGVISVKKIYKYYREYGYKTIVMGASFRNKNEILALAGCDKLTIGPKFLSELENETVVKIEKKLSADLSPNSRKSKPTMKMSEAKFRWEHNEDAMATEKLAEGLRSFNADFEKLKKMMMEKLQ